MASSNEGTGTEAGSNANDSAYDAGSEYSRSYTGAPPPSTSVEAGTCATTSSATKKLIVSPSVTSPIGTA